MRDELAADDIEWEEPSARRRSGGLDSEVEQVRQMVRALRREPGRWAVLCEYESAGDTRTTSRASLVASQLRKKFPELEFAGRGKLNGGSKLHVRQPPREGS